MSFKEIHLRYARELFSFIFGIDGRAFFPDECEVEVSPSTGKLRRIWLNGKCLATVRAEDGLISLTLHGGERLLGLVEGVRHQVVVNERGVSRVKEGYDVSAGEVVDADPAIIPSSEVLVVDEARRLVGVGKAVLTAVEMKELRNGTAVKVRHKV
ncbi:MAG: PUA domain-containing protein [Candidatus Caldarchaeum sp.]